MRIEVKDGKGMRGEGERNCKGEGAVYSNLHQDVKRPGKIIILFYEKERKLCKKRESDGGGVNKSF